VHVYKGQHGKHVVAPFVDLREPRYGSPIRFCAGRPFDTSI
jgi:hypothetical protein